MEQAGEVDYLITWRDEFVGRVSLTPCRRAGANRRCFAFPKSPSWLRLWWDRPPDRFGFELERVPWTLSRSYMPPPPVTAGPAGSPRP
jgi:hypothetical protein